MDYHIIFIGLMALVVAFLYVDITSGEEVSIRAFKIYGALFLLFGLFALITYIVTE